MNNKKHVSLKDLAEELGVSVSTVSRALKDSPEVGEEMRERVKKLAGEWNYRPNPFAISLLKNNPRIIGIIVPDIVTMAKGIGNGITVGAIAAKEEVAKCLVPGDHGTTFGGNPLACAAVAKTLEIFEKREIPNHVEEVGEYLSECLQKLVEKKEIAVETRGMGLMRGLELSVPAGPYITKALEKGVIFMSAGANVIRFIPPLIIEKSDVDKMIAILDSVLDD